MLISISARAIAFYRRWGFVEVGSELYPAGEISVTALLMTRLIEEVLP